MDLDPLGNDWKARGERGTAILRERAIDEASGNLVPVDAVARILVDLAGSCNGMLQSIADSMRGLGAAEDVVTRVVEIVQDVQLQISIALDQAVTNAAEEVERMEAEIEARDPANLEAMRGPKERKEARQHRGKPHSGNTKPKKVRAQ